MNSSMPKNTNGSGRDVISDAAERQRLEAIGALISDERRSRPNYFDGRFLTAADLSSEQTYFLTRQADLARASGYGVINGLMVSEVEGTRASTVRIGRGRGLTPNGELVMLDEDQEVNLADLAEIQRLNQALGLSAIPAEPQRTATGLFLLGLRLVEYTDDPIVSYPTSPGGERTVENGYTFEATAITLIPYSNGGQGTSLQRRGLVSREIFLSGDAFQSSESPLLPLAMVALSKGIVEWVDTWLVRREWHQDARQILTMADQSMAIREAHLHHYSQRLREVIDERLASNRDLLFSAAEHFAVLPPVGELPRATIQAEASSAADASSPVRFTQIFFPPEVEVDLSLIPEDELPAVIADSLPLPPIDLTLSAEERDSIAVLILIPVARSRLQDLIARLRLPDQPRLSPLRRALLPAAGGQLAKRLPLEILRGIRKPPASRITLSSQNQIDERWREELDAHPLLWFARRRNFPYRSDVVQIQEVDT